MCMDAPFLRCHEAWPVSVLPTGDPASVKAPPYLLHQLLTSSSLEDLELPEGRTGLVHFWSLWFDWVSACPRRMPWAC